MIVALDALLELALDLQVLRDWLATSVESIKIRYNTQCNSYWACFQKVCAELLPEQPRNYGDANHLGNASLAGPVANHRPISKTCRARSSRSLERHRTSPPLLSLREESMGSSGSF